MSGQLGTLRMHCNCSDYKYMIKQHMSLCHIVYVVLRCNYRFTGDRSGTIRHCLRSNVWVCHPNQPFYRPHRQTASVSERSAPLQINTSHQKELQQNIVDAALLYPSITATAQYIPYKAVYLIGLATFAWSKEKLLQKI